MQLLLYCYYYTNPLTHNYQNVRYLRSSEINAARESIAQQCFDICE